MPSYYITDVEDDRYYVRTVSPEGYVAGGDWWTIIQVAEQLAHGASLTTAEEQDDGSFEEGAEIHLELRTSDGETVADSLARLRGS